MNAVIYTRKTCAYCPMAKEFLTRRGVKIIEKNADTPEIREEAIKVSGVETVPIIVMNGHTLIGYNPTQIVGALS